MPLLASVTLASGRAMHLEIPCYETIADVKDEVYARWRIKPERQMLVTPSMVPAADNDVLLKYVPWLAVGEWLAPADPECSWDFRTDLDMRLIVMETHVAVRLCRVCGAGAAKKCSGCHVARYCGGACQHADWRAHRRTCRRWSCITKETHDEVCPGVMLRAETAVA